MNYYHNFMEESLAPNFKDLPINECFPNSSLIEISFTLSRNMVANYDTLEFHNIINMIGNACTAISASSEDKWDFYHPQLVYKPPQSEKPCVIIAKFFGKTKEQETMKPSDTESSVS